MDLNSKHLYALRDLAESMGVHAPTSYTKDRLINLILSRKADLENGVVPAQAPASKRGRPRLDNRYLGFKTDERGKIVFYETDRQERNVGNVTPSLKKPIIKKENKREQLKRIRDLLSELCNAIDIVLEN